MESANSHIIVSQQIRLLMCEYSHRQDRDEHFVIRLLRITSNTLKEKKNNNISNDHDHRCMRSSRLGTRKYANDAIECNGINPSSIVRRR